MFIGLYCCLFVRVQPLSLTWADLHHTDSLWALFQGPIVEFRLGYPIFYLGTLEISPLTHIKFTLTIKIYGEFEGFLFKLIQREILLKIWVFDSSLRLAKMSCEQESLRHFVIQESFNTSIIEIQKSVKKLKKFFLSLCFQFIYRLLYFYDISIKTFLNYKMP